MKPPTCRFKVEFLGPLVVRKSILPCENLRLASAVYLGSTLLFDVIKAVLLETTWDSRVQKETAVLCLPAVYVPLALVPSCTLPFSPLVLVCWNWLHHFIVLLPLLSGAMASLHNHCHDCWLTSRFAGPQADEVAAEWSLACGPDLFQQRWPCHPSQLRVNAPWLSKERSRILGVPPSVSYTFSSKIISMGHDLKGNIIASPNEGISWLSVHHVLCCPDFHHCIRLWPCHTHATVSIHDSLLLSFLLCSHPLAWKSAGLISSKDSELVVF